MIKFNYKIERDEHDETKIYTPSIPHELKNVVLIEGPNSSGKSTLLNILGLSFYGYKDENISPSLKEKMHDLLDSSHQKIHFSVEIKNYINNINLFIEKKNTSDDITIYDRFQGSNNPMSEERFRKNYRLIYDIPEDPLRRLPKLLEDLKIEQIRMSNRIQQLQNHLRSILNEIQNARNPQQIIQLKNYIKDLENEKNSKEKSVKSFEVDLLMIEKYSYSRLYLEYTNELIKINNEIKKIGQIKRIEKKKERNESEELQNLKEKAGELVKSIKNNMAELLKYINILFKEDEFIYQWERIDLEKELIYQNERGFLIRGIVHFKSQLLKKDLNHRNDPKSLTANLISKLIDVLRQYQNSPVKIPGIESSIPDFLKLLENKKFEFQRLQKEFDNINQALIIIDALEKDIQIFTDQYSKRLKELLSSKKEEVPEDNLIINQIEKLDDLGKDKEEINAKINFYEKLCIKKEVPLDKISDFQTQIANINKISLYSKYNEEQLKNEIEQIRKDIPSAKDGIELVSSEIQRCKERIKTFEEKKPSEYLDYKDKIESYYSQCQLLIQLFYNQYPQYLKELLDKKTGLIQTEDQKLYYEKVSYFLAEKIGKFHHSEKSFHADKIDYKNDEIITKEGKIIKFSDLGTGQAQSAYIMGLINIQDKRKLIVLLDEVATMDSSSIAPIIDKLKKLYKEGRLLLGIIVQKADKPHIRSYID